MSISGSVPISGHEQGGQSLTLDTVADVDQLVALLSEPTTHTATLETSRAAIDAHVQDGRGYLLYSGDEVFGYSIGDETSPAVESEVGFPAGAGLPIEQFRKALVEFVATEGRLPTSVPWRDAADLPAQP
ncbi:Imm1 family immunity protein [Amycolatopsis palatopharyngis]|uniref:Imm1 family immunity protein n=1 Tax=Amycolatopsis palatopharyngis TaxID=187982 RepID=UPI000E278170|nr:Imm1 family immunity protein [Amycolatopsis palatopharyngis]